MIDVTYTIHDEKCYICGRTIDDYKNILDSAVIKVNENLNSKLNDNVKYVTNLIAKYKLLLDDTKYYPANINVYEILQTKEMSIKIMPRIIDLLLVIGIDPDTKYLPISYKQLDLTARMNVTDMRNKLSQIIDSLQRGVIPGDLNTHNIDVTKIILSKNYICGIKKDSIAFRKVKYTMSTDIKNVYRPIMSDSNSDLENALITIEYAVCPLCDNTLQRTNIL
jgi:hypothetical protein